MKGSLTSYGTELPVTEAPLDDEFSSSWQAFIQTKLTHIEKLSFYYTQVCFMAFHARATFGD